MKIIEGVRYYPFLVSYRLRSGKRKSFTYYSPGEPWVRSEVARLLDDEVGIENIAPGSAKISPKKTAARRSR